MEPTKPCSIADNWSGGETRYCFWNWSLQLNWNCTVTSTGEIESILIISCSASWTWDAENNQLKQNWAYVWQLITGSTKKRHFMSHENLLTWNLGPVVQTIKYLLLEHEWSNPVLCSCSLELPPTLNSQQLQILQIITTQNKLLLLLSFMFL